MKNFLLPFTFLFLLITETNAQLIVNAGGDLSVCYGNSVGLAATAAGGTPPYTFHWTPSADLNNANIANPTLVVYSNNNYIVQVTDNLGAQSSDTIHIAMLPNPSIYFYASDSLTCVDAPVTFPVTVSSGTAPFTYAWDFGDGSTANVNNPTHVYNAQGNYQPTLTVTDANGCSATLMNFVSVSQLVTTALLTPVTCFGANNGTMQALTTGGFPPYFYNWNNGANTQTVGNLSAGTYAVTAFDSHQCSATAVNTLTEPTPITIATTATNESAAGACDGLLVLTGGGGVQPYTINWSNGYTMPTINGLCSGTYTVTITDANGCTAASAGVVGSGSCTNNTLVVSITSQDLSCTHPADTMVANVSGGTPPYTYVWTGSAFTYSTPAIVTTHVGIYTVYISDSLGCVKTATDTLTSTGIVVSLAYTTPASCNGIAEGAAKINVTSGTPPYTFAWSNGATADSIVNVAGGVYTVTITDAALCSVVYTVNVLQNNTNWSYYVYVSSTTTNCANNGTATAVVAGGTSPFSYLWSNNDTTATISNLAAGNYTLTVTDADGCVRLGSVAITTNCYNVITGNIFIDANNNCVQDSAETGSYTYYYVTATGSGGTYYGYAYYNGLYQINIPVSGSFTVTISTGGWGNGCSNVNLCSAQVVSFSGVGDTTVLNFGVSAASGFDLSLHPGWTGANPGFTKQYWVLIYQQSQPAYSGPATIIFKYDSILQYQSSNNSGVHNAANRTITWQVADASANVQWSNRPQAFLTVPANTPISYQLKQEFWLLPYSGDCDTTDNHQIYTEPVTGSMDPNEKDVSPAGDIQEEDSALTYTIHFQNTGNDTTWFITVKDTLSSYLNPATVQNMASSHEYTSFDVSGNGILTWFFNPIFLVDSATNEPASKGFVTFRVKKKAGLPLNTEIKNTAHIYFDYNEAVVTNTVTSKLTEPNYVFSLSGYADINVNVIPNPFTQSATINVEGVTGAYNFELFDVSGKRLKIISGITDSRFTINRDAMSTGVYFYSITTLTKQKAFGRLMVQ